MSLLYQIPHLVPVIGSAIGVPQPSYDPAVPVEGGCSCSDPSPEQMQRVVGDDLISKLKSRVSGSGLKLA
jgi:hypothetical protein